MKSFLAALIVLTLFSLLPAAAQAPPPPVDPLVREVRTLKQQVYRLRGDLARARVEASESKTELLGEVTRSNRSQREELQHQLSILTGTVVLLGGIALLALLLAARTLRSRGAERRQIAEARAERIADLRARLRADETRLAELEARASVPPGATDE